MVPYTPIPVLGFGCHTCTHNVNCTVQCEPTASGGTGYKWNNKLTHKVFWIIPTKIKR